MGEEWISQFIDDEMTLDEKIGFVEEIHENGTFREECLDLLRQEKRLREPLVREVPVPEIPSRRRWAAFFRPAWPPAFALLIAGFALVLAVNLYRPAEGQPVPFRFVVFEPSAERLEIAGTFTGWEKVPMKRSGESGYWEIFLSLPPQEHRYTYVVDGERTMADPTAPKRERDDFGGENSIINAGKTV